MKTQIKNITQQGNIRCLNNKPFIQNKLSNSNDCDLLLSNFRYELRTCFIDPIGF